MLAPVAPPAREAGRGWKSPAGGGSSKPFSWLSNARRQTVGRGPPTQPAPEVAPRTPSPSCGLVSKCGRLLRKRARRRETTGPASRLVSCFFLCSFAPPPPPGQPGKKRWRDIFCSGWTFSRREFTFLENSSPTSRSRRPPSRASASPSRPKRAGRRDPRAKDSPPIRPPLLCQSPCARSTARACRTGTLRVVSTRVFFRGSRRNKDEKERQA